MDSQQVRPISVRLQLSVGFPELPGVQQLPPFGVLGAVAVGLQADAVDVPLVRRDDVRHDDGLVRRHAVVLGHASI